MNYEYVPYDEAHYSSNIRYNENRGTLLWDSSPLQDALVVQGPFQEDAAAYMETFCQTGDRPFPAEGQYLHVGSGISFRFVSASERARNNGCPLNGRACTYTVFSCDRLPDSCRIYAPVRWPMNPVSCDIPRRIRVVIRMTAEERGPLQRLRYAFSRDRQPESNLYLIRFENAEDVLEDTIQDGDVYYRAGRFDYPVLKEMLRSGFYVRSRSRPEVASRNPGLEID